MEDSKNVFKKNNILLIVIIATVFGMASGIAGELTARTYLIDSSYDIPFFGEINFSNGNYNGSSLIIRDAKKVVVEQDTKVVETINSASMSLVGIFKKSLPKSEKADNFNLSDYYQVNQEVGQGIIITSDGWIATSFLPAEMEQASQEAGRAGAVGEENFLENYAVITKDGKVYAVDKIIRDKLAKFNFLHVETKDFSVRSFIGRGGIARGQSVVAVNWDGASWLSVISAMESDKDQAIVNSSDGISGEIFLVDEPSEKFNGSFLLNLAGEVAGLIDNQGKIMPASQFVAPIKSLLKNKEIKRASLGVNYVDLSGLVKAPVLNSVQESESNKGAVIYKNKQGAAIVKGGAADKAGLKEGDIIIAIDNIEINKDNKLNDAVGQHIAGDKVMIAYSRDGDKKEVEVVLGELK
jgi:S1-C subfamily serine protease